MPRKPSLATVRRSLIKTIESNLNLFAAVHGLCKRSYEGIQENPLHPNQARRVVSHAFLATVDAWEQYLEATFVRYLAGASAPSGYQPALRVGAAQGLEHAYQLLTGDPTYSAANRFLSWASPQPVIERARVFFNQGAPFAASLSHWQNRLNDANKIRNRIAHTSLKSRNAFKEVALQHLGRSPDHNLRQGYAVGDLLYETAQRNFPGSGSEETYFVEYLYMFIDLADRITPEG